MSERQKRKRVADEPHGAGQPGRSWSSDDSEAAEERAEHHYIMRTGDHFDKGRYSVVAQLGKGTFGRVVEMWDTAEKRAVAVKVIRAVEKCAVCWHDPVPIYCVPSQHTCPRQVRTRSRDRERSYSFAAAHPAVRRDLPHRAIASDV